MKEGYSCEIKGKEWSYQTHSVCIIHDIINLVSPFNSNPWKRTGT